VRDIPGILKDFLFQRDSSPAHRSHHMIVKHSLVFWTTLYLASVTPVHQTV